MKLHHYIFAFLSGFSILIPASSSYAAPGTLPKSPLFISTSVEPNVYITFDNSGSMDWAVIYQSNEDDDTDFTTEQGRPIVADYLRGYLNPEWHDTVWDGGIYVIPPAGYTNDSATWDEKLWVLRNHNGNRLYYNPSITYKPWPGVDDSGNALYHDASATNALRNPKNPDGDAVNLTRVIKYTEPAIECDAESTREREEEPDCENELEIFIPVYYIWKDDGDGIFESSDDHTLVEIKPDKTDYPSGRSYTDELKNFANWFQYYRKREFTAKAGLGSVINNSDSIRMGLYALNEKDTDKKNHKRYLSSMSNSSNKTALLEALYSIDLKGSTPLRTALQKVGNYFMEKKPGDDHVPPILDAEHGGECQQNFNIIMSDGYWNGTTSPGVGNADASESNDGGFDGDASESIDGGNYEDGVSNTLADVAMHYYENDLREDLENKVPQSTVDKATHQHLVTYTLAFGLKGTLTLDSNPTDPGFNWPEASLGDPTNFSGPQKVDDMWHAAYNGRGKYFSAHSPEEFVSSLTVALQDISNRTETYSAVAFNSGKLTTDSIVYITQFNSENWQGSLAAYPIIDTNKGTLASEPKWRAETELDARDFSANPRQIITYNGSQGVPFRWDTDEESENRLSEAMQNDLRYGQDDDEDSDSIAEARLEYLRGNRTDENQEFRNRKSRGDKTDEKQEFRNRKSRGDKTDENQEFRVRDSLLGDIVNSSPVFVGQAGLSWPDFEPFPSDYGKRYSDFKQSTASRDGMVYVGANDGFLHVFDGTSGKEVLAYAPNILSSSESHEGYHYLTEGAYQHNWYVDMTPTISDIYFDGKWHTVLVGALRGGGRGLYALDITNPSPSNFKEAKADDIVMWEFTNNNLGYTYSQPVIALANNGRWVAIFGSGYNASGDGKARLFIVDIEAGVDGWDAGDYIEISTGAGTSENPNGSASPALVDTDGNGTVDRVYAGDLLGNMWAFDLSHSDTSEWGVAFGSDETPEPLFKTASGQPITAKPIIAKHPTIPFDSSNAPNLMVYFGTGQFLVTGDIISTNTQSFYGVWDKGTNSVSDASPLSRASLVEQTVSTNNGYRFISRNVVDYSEDWGWWFDLPDSGERAVTNSTARLDVVFFNSFVPEKDLCIEGGYGWQYTVDMATGGSPLEAVTDTNKDGVVNESDMVDEKVAAATKLNGYMAEPGFIEDISFTGDKPRKVVSLPNIPAGRLSWQELLR